ncbi:hypothetical protein HX900_00045 [Rhizobium sp. WYCCWR 11290]|uniref:Uncharacterized protein n=1 Tax=Rhizobium changzhiense TaxID=2692317 RepID=A0A7Z0U7Z6_9HYPH|nr:hypothetical protein [Rhizobium changzhiense]NZD59517.1 hypothetical protein [Rhizobium changzhiense]
MKPEWLPASEAAQILETRGVDPIEALATIVRQTGEHGLNRYWSLAYRITIRARSGTQWLSTPEIDLPAGTISVPTYANGRRLPEMIAVPLLVATSELDRRWPETLDPQRQKTTADQRAEREATRYFVDVIAPGAWTSKDDAFDLLKSRFPSLSRRHFDTTIWKENVPGEWKKPGSRGNR